MIEFLLDTNICIAIIKKAPQSALTRLQQCTPGQIAISAITLAELEYGVNKSAAKEKNQNALEAFCMALEILNFDENSAKTYGEIRADLERKGTPIEPLDTLIAAQAIAHKLTLVSNNSREFGRIKRLRLENWVE